MPLELADFKPIFAELARGWVTRRVLAPVDKRGGSPRRRRDRLTGFAAKGLRVRSFRPSVSWSWTTSIDQRSLGRVSTIAGSGRDARSLRRARRLTAKSRRAVEPVDALSVDGMTLASKQSVQAPVAEARPLRRQLAGV
jgi:hypothetical protein